MYYVYRFLGREAMIKEYDECNRILFVRKYYKLRIKTVNEW